MQKNDSAYWSDLHDPLAQKHGKDKLEEVVVLLGVMAQMYIGEPIKKLNTWDVSDQTFRELCHRAKRMILGAGTFYDRKVPNMQKYYEMEKAMQEFVTGEIRSRKTYAKFKRILEME